MGDEVNAPPLSDDLVERAARSLWLCGTVWSGIHGATFYSLPPYAQDRHRDDARAALYALAPERARLTAERDEALAKVAEWSNPLRYDGAWGNLGEDSAFSAADMANLDKLPFGALTSYRTYREHCVVYVAHVVTGWTEEGDVDGSEYREFATREEAEQALAEAVKP